MAICPRDGKPCIDDLCYGGGCLKEPGEPMLDRCPNCGGLIAIDGSHRDDCTCGDEFEDDDVWDGEDDDVDDARYWTG